ncbi:MAG: AraC family transcriptional regulator [Pseudomonadota bacterium]|nr:AraC family transcriptional regulator [Pseudomonadota bacterium]
MLAESSTLSPHKWGASLSGAPVLDRPINAFIPGLIRRWQSISPDIEQGALDQHFVSIHLGGPKRLSRRGEGSAQSRDVPTGAYSVIPAGAAFRWTTEGPVDFTHIYFTPDALNRVIGETFDRDPSRVVLAETLGEQDPLLTTIALSLIEELSGGDEDCAYLDDLMHLLLCRTLRLHSDVAVIIDRARHALAPFRLRRAIDFIEGNLAAPIGVPEIATACGVSPYHFSRAFRQATGRPPYAFLIERRIARAKTLLATKCDPLSDIARQCGFASLSQFSRAFRRDAGTTPTLFRDRC